MIVLKAWVYRVESMFYNAEQDECKCYCYAIVFTKLTQDDSSPRYMLCTTLTKEQKLCVDCSGLNLDPVLTHKLENVVYCLLHCPSAQESLVFTWRQA